MKFFVISGAEDTGKTTILNHIGNWLTEVKGYKDVGEITPVFFERDEQGKIKDIYYVLTNNFLKVITISATDDEECLNILLEALKIHADADIVITTCRDIHDPRSYFINHVKPKSSFYLEVPVAKVNRRNEEYKKESLEWYYDSVFNLSRYILETDDFRV
ncbi:hypothetical protein [Pseudopedobacter sp.]|uniref:hypothetical protein n=1 Tax=Pseudopedobacter sp. TaxID=1936787 RepID=UPI00333E509D